MIRVRRSFVGRSLPWLAFLIAVVVIALLILKPVISP